MNIFGIFLSASMMLANAHFQEENIAIDVESAALPATLVIPGEGATDLVIIVAGSGPTDRNGNSLPGLNTDAYKLIAEALAIEGIASLRYDKRGIGKSSSDLTEAQLRLHHFVDDLDAWAGWAESDGRFERIWLLGHSEGAMLSLAVAGKRNLAGMISVAGAGRPLGVLLREQTEGRRPGEIGDQFERILSGLEAGHRVEDVPPLLMPLFRPSVQPFLIDWLAVDPAALASEMDHALLIIQGGADLQVTEADAQALAAARPDAALVLIPDMNHVLKSAAGELAAQLPSYSNPALPLHEDLAPAIVGFINARGRR